MIKHFITGRIAVMPWTNPTIENKANVQLPFTGRAEELERLESYCQSAQDAQGLRIALLIGEAGIGKSRLLEELMQKIDNERGALIHIKLRPGATTSILPLLTERITESEPGHKSILQKSVGTMSSVIAALQRICRLYPTVMIIEDIHLLNGDTFQEFRQLLDSLSDEFMSIICASRPMDIAVRGVLERYLVEELQLKGLHVNEMEAMWNSVFDSGIDKQFSASIMRITQGNPLAIRTAIRYSLSNQGKSIAGRSTNLSSSFIRGIENVTQLLAEGLAGYLTAEERRAASTLACLGEVFSRETAMAFQPAIQDHLEQLIIKGIVLPTTTATNPLPGSNHTNSRPLAFTHSLVHNYFLSQATVDSDRLLRVIATEQELFSTIPVELLTQAVVGLTVPVDEAIRCIEHCLRIGHLLRETADWQLAHRYCACVEEVLGRYVNEFKTEDYKKVRIEFLELDAWLLSHHSNADDVQIRNHILEQIRLSENPQTKEMSRLRLIALRQYYWMLYSSNYKESGSVLAEVQEIIGVFPELQNEIGYIRHIHLLAQLARKHDDEKGLLYVQSKIDDLIGLATTGFQSGDLTKEVTDLIERFPDLKLDLPYLRYLFVVAGLAWKHQDEFQMTIVKHNIQHISEILQQVQTPAHIIEFLHTRVYPELLLVYQTLEEQEHNLHLLEYYREIATECGPEFWFIRACMYVSGTKQSQMYNVCTEAINAYRELGNYPDYEINSRALLFCTGLTDESGLQKHNDHLQDLPSGIGIWDITANLCFVHAMLSNNQHLLSILENQFVNNEIANTSLECAVLKVLRYSVNIDNDLQTFAEKSFFQRKRQRVLFHKLLLAQIGAIPSSAEDMVQFATKLLNYEIIRFENLTILSAVIELLVHTSSRSHESVTALNVLEPIIRDTFSRSIDWLIAREFPGYIEPLLDRYGQRFLDPEHIQALRQKVSDLRNRHIETASNHSTEKSNRLGITMLGTISICKPGAEPEKIRGNRIRMLLGAMVANHMLGYTLDHDTFCKIACSEEVYRESARKNLNSAVYRLREFMGHDAVCLINNIPRLNLEFVAVDLIEGCSLLKSAKLATQASDFSKASEQLLLAMRIFRSEVAFPALYEEFFEHQREKLELELRSVILLIAKSLVKDQKFDDAGRLLEHALVCLQEDQELEEMNAKVKRMNRNYDQNP